MNKATFRAYREFCGLTQGQVADRQCVTIMTVKRWEREGDNPVPENAAKWIREQRRMVVALAERHRNVVLDMAEATGDKSAVLRYYRVQEELDMARHKAGLPPEDVGVINAATRLAGLLLEGDGFDVVYSYG